MHEEAAVPADAELESAQRIAELRAPAPGLRRRILIQALFGRRHLIRRHGGFRLGQLAGKYQRRQSTSIHLAGERLAGERRGVSPTCPDPAVRDRWTSTSG